MNRRRLILCSVLLVALTGQPAFSQQEVPLPPAPASTPSMDEVLQKMPPQLASQISYVVEAPIDLPYMALRTQTGGWAILLDSSDICSPIIPGKNVLVGWLNGEPSDLQLLTPDAPQGLLCQVVNALKMDSVPCAMRWAQVCDIAADPVDWREP